MYRPIRTVVDGIGKSFAIAIQDVLDAAVLEEIIHEDDQHIDFEAFSDGRAPAFIIIDRLGEMRFDVSVGYDVDEMWVLETYGAPIKSADFIRMVFDGKALSVDELGFHEFVVNYTSELEVIQILTLLSQLIPTVRWSGGSEFPTAYIPELSSCGSVMHLHISPLDMDESYYDDEFRLHFTGLKTTKQFLTYGYGPHPSMVSDSTSGDDATVVTYYELRQMYMRAEEERAKEYEATPMTASEMLLEVC